MAEQSHKREMADALRGDFDRLRARGVETTLTAVEHFPEQELPFDGPPEPPAASAPAATGLRRFFTRN
jgi:hypothetical protein